MDFSSLTPVSAMVSQAKKEKALRGDSLPEYLRQANFDPESEYESVFVPNTGLKVFPTVVDVKTCIPVYNGSLIPVNMYTRDGIGIRFNSSYAGRIVYLYRPKMTYGSGYERNDEVTYRLDVMASSHLKYGYTIQDSVGDWKPFRVTIPYEGAPDKIANKVYGDYTYWQVIMQYNGFIYPEHCVLDSIIKIPDFNQVNAWLKKIASTGTTNNDTGMSNPAQYKGKQVRL